MSPIQDQPPQTKLEIKKFMIKRVPFLLPPLPNIFLHTVSIQTNIHAPQRDRPQDPTTSSYQEML